MQKVILFVALIATAFVQKSFAQDTPLASLLTQYYNIKNALVAGNAATASTEAEAFVKTLKSVDLKSINEGTRDALVKDAEHISETKELAHQREHFASFSSNMYTLAKAAKLTTQPVYYDYCPMKKAHWLSSDKAIKNPYYGSSMLTCGKVEETVQ